jgi:hypothetical protein
MITSGVIIYSTRKRFRLLSGIGKLQYFLEFHIFLCLAGPFLVLYHTTFKFGGLVAVSFWSMAMVVASGVVGRYLYVQIPKGLQGNELSAAELAERNESLRAVLIEKFKLSPALLRELDAIAIPPHQPMQMSMTAAVRFFIVNDLTRRSRLRAFASSIELRRIGSRDLRRLLALARQRVILNRRIAFLQQCRRLFRYWHVVHLPFTIVMFVILAIHVAVAIAFGYTWIW